MHLAQEFLEAHGTEFKTSFKRTDRDLIETYAVIRGNYTDTGRADGGKLSPSKYRAPLVSNPLRDHDFYINAHHEDLMLRNHGELYRAIATATTNPNAVQPLSEARKQTLNAQIPLTMLQLKNIGVNV